MTAWLAVVFVLVGCGSTTPAASTSASPSAPPRSAVPGSSTPAAPAPSGSTSTASQTDTEWGRIWDSLPAGFPAVAGSTPSEEAADGAASATLVVNGNTAQAIATSMQTALRSAGFQTEALSGPLEDGTYVLDAEGDSAGCKVEVRASPLGGVTTVTILYGADCPHD